MKNSLLAKSLLAACAAAVCSATASAALVTWEFNPAGLNQNVGSSSLTFTQSGYSIVARGYDNLDNGATGLDSARQLRYKNEPDSGGAKERGLGLFETASNELTLFPNGTVAEYIQLDLRSILGLGFVGGQVQVTSMQDGEGFRLFASNIQGALGTQLPGTWTGLTFDNKFVNVPSFGSFQFLTIAANSGRILPVAFQAFEPIPEMSALLPVVALLTVVLYTGMRRRSCSAR